MQQILLGDKSSLAVVEAVGWVNHVTELSGIGSRVVSLKNNSTILPSPIADLKAIKNETELEGFRQSHIRDGAALARYFAWLEEQLENGVELTESQGADKLEQFRS
jgi:Xaa-Pro aminopeptidase